MTPVIDGWIKGLVLAGDAIPVDNKKRIACRGTRGAVARAG
jgi:hypothetical protein